MCGGRTEHELLSSRVEKVGKGGQRTHTLGGKVVLEGKIRHTGTKRNVIMEMEGIKKWTFSKYLATVAAATKDMVVSMLVGCSHPVKNTTQGSTLQSLFCGTHYQP